MADCGFTLFWIFQRHGGVIGRCLYCGRNYCSEHGVVYDDGQEICGREICQDKYHELPRYQEYRVLTSNRNSNDRCGVGECVNVTSLQCSRCQSVFCVEHVLERHEAVPVRGRTQRRYLSLCDYCWERRKIWNRI